MSSTAYSQIYIIDQYHYKQTMWLNEDRLCGSGTVLLDGEEKSAERYVSVASQINNKTDEILHWSDATAPATKQNKMVGCYNKSYKPTLSCQNIWTINTLTQQVLFKTASVLCSQKGAKLQCFVFIPKISAA